MKKREGTEGREERRGEEREGREGRKDLETFPLPHLHYQPHTHTCTRAHRRTSWSTVVPTSPPSPSTSEQLRSIRPYHFKVNDGDGDGDGDDDGCVMVMVMVMMMMVMIMMVVMLMMWMMWMMMM